MGILSLDGVFTRKHNNSSPGHHLVHQTYNRTTGSGDISTSGPWARARAKSKPNTGSLR